MTRRFAAAIALAVLAVPARADRFPVPADPLYREECGSCHLAYPPQLLDAASWRAVMNGLGTHFGSDASLDAGNATGTPGARRSAIADFLAANAGGRTTGATADAGGRPLLRLTETAWFARKHRKLDPAIWARASIKSPANCAACHTRAADGDYGERSIVIPE